MMELLPSVASAEQINLGAAIEQPASGMALSSY